MAIFFRRTSKLAEHNLKVGISFSQTELTLAYVTQEPSKNIQLKYLEQFQVDEKKRKEFLKEKIQFLNLQNHALTLLLPEQDYQIISLEKPQVPEEEQQKAIHWIISEYIDFPVDEAMMDYIDLPKKENSENNQSIYVIVTAKKKIEEIVSWVVPSGLKIASIDIPQSALRKIAIRLENQEESQAFLHIGLKKSQLIIFKDKKLYMMREIDLGLNRLKLSPQQETIDDIIGYRDLSVEIQRSLDYCVSNLHSQNITRLILSPLTEKIPVLLSYLSNILGVPVRELDYQEFLNFDATLKECRESSGIYAIGAALF